MLQGEFGEIGLDGINGEDVSVCYIRFCGYTSYRIMYDHQCVYVAKTSECALVYASLLALIGICWFSG